MKTNIEITIGELMDRGKWLEACELLGLNEWCVNEGISNTKDIVDLTIEEAKKLRLL